MKLDLRRLSLWVLPVLVLVLVFVAHNVLAADEDNSKAALTLAQGLLCDTKHLLEGYVGLLLGLILIFVGIWSLASGGSAQGALLTIFFGALITSLPSLIISTMQGFGQLMEETNMSAKWQWVEPEQCQSGSSGGSTSTYTPEEKDDDVIHEPPSFFLN